MEGRRVRFGRSSGFGTPGGPRGRAKSASLCACPPPARCCPVSRAAHLHQALAPHLQKLEDWARLYVRYVQTFRKLCAAHDGLAHPQKRAALHATLTACLGRLLELRAWSAELIGGCSVLDLGQQLADLQLTPDALELPVPSYFREMRAEALAARSAAAAAAVGAAEAPSCEGAGTDGQKDAEEEAAPEHGNGVHGQAGASGRAGQAPPLQHAACLQAETLIAKQPHAPPKQQQQRAQPHQQPRAHRPAAAAAASAPSPEPEEPELQAQRTAAAATLQAGVRSWLVRRRLQAEQRQELEFLGMAAPAQSGRSAALAGRLAAESERRKQLQSDRSAEMGQAMVAIKARLRQHEGWSMKERIRDKVGCFGGGGCPV